MRIPLYYNHWIRKTRKNNILVQKALNWIKIGSIESLLPCRIPFGSMELTTAKLQRKVKKKKIIKKAKRPAPPKVTRTREFGSAPTLQVLYVDGGGSFPLLQDALFAVSVHMSASRFQAHGIGNQNRRNRQQGQNPLLCQLLN